MALERILAHKRQEVAARQNARPLAELRGHLTPSQRSLEEALRRPRTGFVMECKKASPSKGLIRADFDPAAIARSYAPFADAISVLADEHFFSGSLQNVTTVSDAVSLPVLLKDFVLGPYQVYEARAHGADAILLMLSVLDDDTFSACFNAAEELALDALVEVHDEQELHRALALGARIIGINNRNLKTLDVDLAVTERLAPLVPADRVVVAESGIRDHRDLVRLRPLVDAFLVGSSLMARADLDHAIRELVFGPTKVCGLTRPEDAVAAWQHGAIFGGLIFASKSPRVVTPERAAELVRAAPLRWVGVFADEAAATVAQIARTLDLYAVQLHGGENDDYVASLKATLSKDCQVWRALPVADQTPDLAALQADRVILDTARAGGSGGTGERFDWSLLHGLDLSRALLAGGLDADSAEAADGVGAAGLDVSSGLEERRGVKSVEKMARFFSALRGTTRRHAV